MESKKAAGRACIVGAALLWGLAGVCVKSITWGTMPQVAFRSLLSLLLLALSQRKIRLHWTRGNILGAVMMSVTGILYIQAIKLTTAGTAIVLQYVAPILVFLYGVIFRHQKPRPVEIVLTLLVFGGVVLSFADSLDGTRLAGNLLALLSGFTFAGQIIVMNRKDVDSGDSLMMSCLMSLIAAVPFLFFDPGLSFDGTNLLWLTILGVFQYGLANLLFGLGVHQVDALECSLLLTIEPIFNPIPVAIICGEHMGLKAIIGSAIVIVCVALYAALPAIRKKTQLGL